MSQRMPINPDICYLLGMCTFAKEAPFISVSSANENVIERFIKTAIGQLGIDPKKITVGEYEGVQTVGFFNSLLKNKLKKLLLERERILKYHNDYSGSYFAGVFDVRGGIDRKGIFLMHIDLTDVIVLERLGFRVTGRGTSRIHSPDKFAALIRPYSAKLKYLEKDKISGHV